MKYRTVEADGTANINLRSGTVRFWFKPLWNSGTGTGDAAKLIEVGSRGDELATNGWWSLFANAAGDTLYFVSQTNNAVDVTNLTASVSFTSNRWCQLVLTYTNGAVALYTNGVLCVSDTASLAYPPLATRTNGFTLGCATDGTEQAKGVFEDLETFNYPQAADDILENFQLTQPPMLISDLRMWLNADSGFQTNALGQVDSLSDQSGNTNNATQIGNARPYYFNGWINGTPAIYFPGTNSISFTITNSLFTNAIEAEVFVMMQAKTNRPTQTRGFWRMGPGTYYLTTDGNLRDDFGASPPTDTGFPAQRIDQPHIFNAVAASNESTIRLNGVIHFTRNTNTVTFSSSPRLGIGGAGGSFEGYVAEVLLYSRRLTDNERTAASVYLGQRYGLVSELPATPTNLAAFAVSTSQISVGWSNVLSNTNISFILQRRSNGVDFTTIARLQNTLSFVDSGLTADTLYSYRVKAINFAGESAFSVETNVTTLSSGPAIPLDSLKIWLKGDCGLGGDPVSCWLDQTTNNFSAYFKYNDIPKQPLCFNGIMNGRPAMSFQATNGFSLPKFTSGWNEGEALVVLKSLVPMTNQYSALWWMGDGSLAGWHPDPNGHVWENFGRTTAIDTGVPSEPYNQTNAHLYSVAAATNLFTIWLNNSVHYSTNANSVGFPENPRFGWGANGSMFRGYISEAMFFNRVLSTNERNAVVTNYLNKRYDLW